jgi:hypothetical protein
MVIRYGLNYVNLYGEGQICNFGKVWGYICNFPYILAVLQQRELLSFVD